ncbi:CorA metal ion transporter [Tulasnella sp. JGI-2019a]|nr:CorA metal ion transporter [Tulasnella sp. JGI-2019a]KAG9015776.1 CorA metal ion transporter [Tulasnella sp. JGI-2019a]KAG9039591.1 CorA metal ion transporter [Tulasnella sp. JGI-2019a]
MSSPHKPPMDALRSIRIDPAAITDRNHVRSPSGGSPPQPGAVVGSSSGPRLSPTLTRTFDMNDVEARERQRAMDVDSAMQLSRARSNSVSQTSPLDGYEAYNPQEPMSAGVGVGNGGTRSRQSSDDPVSAHSHSHHHFPMMSVAEMEEMAMARGDYPPVIEEEETPEDICTPAEPAHNIRDFDHEAERLGVDMGLVDSALGGAPDLPINEASASLMAGLPTYQPNAYSSHFDFASMDNFASEERTRLGLSPPSKAGPKSLASMSTGAELKRRLAQAQVESNGGFNINVKQHDDNTSSNDATNGLTPAFDEAAVASGSSTFSRRRQRKLSQSNSTPRRQGKLALFENHLGSPAPALVPTSSHLVSFAPTDIYHSAPASYPRNAAGASPGPSGSSSAIRPQDGGMGHSHSSHGQGHDRPYRFSFYSAAQTATIHARSLSELPAEGETFEELFQGRKSGSTKHSRVATPGTEYSGGGGPVKGPGFHHAPGGAGGGGGPGSEWDPDKNTWWLDVTCPTDDEMRLLGKVFSIHPLTTEDILMEETREKIELFRHYYFVCFRSFDQDVYSPTYLEPLNMYIIVFREGTLSFHFRGTTHPQSVRRRIKQLKDYINVTSDWISYALIDDITDAFGPLIQNIEYEVDSIDELVLILKETEQSDMLRRIGTCRKKVMGLLRLMGNKADVVKGLAKRCNENWSVAPKSDIGLYLSDIQDHLITMTQNLNHYEKILSRSHSNYLAQISIEMTDANNQINDVLSKLTALGTVLVPMNLVTGLWGMNVHVPGQDAGGYAWFLSIIGALVGFAIIGGLATYRLLRSS